MTSTVRYGKKTPSFAARKPGICPRCWTTYHVGDLIKFGQYGRPIHGECPILEDSVNTTNPDHEGE